MNIVVRVFYPCPGPFFSSCLTPTKIMLSTLNGFA